MTTSFFIWIFHLPSSCMKDIGLGQEVDTGHFSYKPFLSSCYRTFRHTTENSRFRSLIYHPILMGTKMNRFDRFRNIMILWVHLRRKLARHFDARRIRYAVFYGCERHFSQSKPQSSSLPEIIRLSIWPNTNLRSREVDVVDESGKMMDQRVD